MYPAKDVKITLVAKKKPLTTCFPTDDGIDSITKYLQVRDILESPVKGRYFGYYKSNPKDTATVTIKVAFEKDRFDNNIYNLTISNINKGCNQHLEDDAFKYPNVTWKGFYVNAENSYGLYQCFDPKIIAVLASNHQDININFSYTFKTATNSKRLKDTFIGKRIKK